MYKTLDALIENTIFEARMDESDNVISYRISPAEGYKLHEITLDEKVIDKETCEETGEIKKGFTTSYITAGVNYNFEKNPRQIYAVKKGDDT